MSETPSLAELVIAFLAQHPGQAYTPSQIAEGISIRLDGRHVGLGAVINTCCHLVAADHLLQVGQAPRTFAYLARTASRQQ